MALKVIGAGFGRTGTMSLYTALNQLGLPCYHMIEVLKNPRNRTHLDFWLRVARGTGGEQHDWEQVFEHYAAAVDNPACCVWRELLAAYPDAKVILTTHPRGAAAWYDSTIDTIYFTESMWQFKVLEALTPFGAKFGEMSRKLIWQRTLHGTMNDRARAIARHDEHVAEVKAAVPPERLLVFSVDEGWGPLCRFLGVAEPQSPFPNVNDRAQIKAEIRNIVRGAYVMVGLAAAAAAALVYGAVRWLG
ncbi:MAG TPA: sulfotransferase [Ramlibacter sp.]|uniref:sulfotransferase family protein n=1 Tax=Ramlibacter sp. TaxID=1917967 RepID=UPI002C08E917|nr:sulfotransferase [Ramlibacter sp.]HVZ45915.1 sulfotransferase [Ramlibacter sp.]